MVGSRDQFGELIAKRIQVSCRLLRLPGRRQCLFRAQVDVVDRVAYLPHGGGLLIGRGENLLGGDCCIADGPAERFDGQVSFADRDFKLVAVPKAKRAEFFGLATPLKIKGEFDDFRISMKGGALTLGSTAVKFVISPVTTPFKRLFQKDLPEDGADICSLPIGPRTQQLQTLPGC